jgi:hypothetical protein
VNVALVAAWGQLIVWPVGALIGFLWPIRDRHDDEEARR